MKKRFKVLTAVTGAAVFTALFYKQSLGLNLLIFDSLLMAWLWGTGKVSLKNKLQLIVLVGFLLTAIFTVVTNSVFVYAIHWLCMLTLSGIIAFPEAKSMLNSMGMGVSNLLFTQIGFIEELSESKSTGGKIIKMIWRSRIFIIPAFIILFFTIIYSLSNPVFERIVTRIMSSIGDFLYDIFGNMDLSIIFMFVFGLLLCNIFIIRKLNKIIKGYDESASDQLIRKKNTWPKFTSSLKNEYKAGVFLLIVLNAILLVINIIDINWVWFNFTWQGEYLKQFVHEGTWLLILSILISIALVLYFFRGNLNFYSKNTFLKYLSYAWLAQNAVLTISVAMRNFWYIHYLALAYKRIGVIIFLLLTLYGLYTVFVKVREKKSAFFLFRTNMLAIFIVLVLSSLPNWDRIIARYNFAHADRSFLHLDYLSSLSDKVLPDLEKPLEDLQEIDRIQKQKFPFEAIFMTPQDYHEVIISRKKAFVKRWETMNILEWNLAEYLAYRRIKAHEGK
jgi:hypothetical protein